MKHLTQIAINKALQSQGRYKISAIGLDHKGNVLGSCFNHVRFDRYGGGAHAEMRLVQRYKTNVKTIIICRVGRSGNVLPIKPCNKCQKILDKLKIKTVTITA